VDRFYDGLLALADRHGVPLAGGDLAQSPAEGEGKGGCAKAMADIVVVGAVPRGRALLRSGARPGDVLYVTGSLGGAAAELRALEHAPRQFRSVAVHVTGKDTNHPHFFPEPRLRTGQALLRRRLATAAIDISDGLSVDLGHLCEESDVRAEIDVPSLPLGANATLEDALQGGDDYELLFTTGPAMRMPLRIGGVAVTRIGRVLAKRRGRATVELVDRGVRTPLVAQGWQHF
jgi:thiamine-monophosphate kinase